MENREGAVEIRGFSGLNNTADPHDIPPGAAVALVNCRPLGEGRLDVRRGVRLLRYTNTLEGNY